MSRPSIWHDFIEALKGNRHYPDMARYPETDDWDDEDGDDDDISDGATELSCSLPTPLGQPHSGSRCQI